MVEGWGLRVHMLIHALAYCSSKILPLTHTKVHKVLPIRLIPASQTSGFNPTHHHHHHVSSIIIS